MTYEEISRYFANITDQAAIKNGGNFESTVWENEKTSNYFLVSVNDNFKINFQEDFDKSGTSQSFGFRLIYLSKPVDFRAQGPFASNEVKKIVYVFASRDSQLSACTIEQVAEPTMKSVAHTSSIQFDKNGNGIMEIEFEKDENGTFKKCHEISHVSLQDFLTNIENEISANTLVIS